MLLQVESLPSMVNKVWSMDSNMQLDATTQFRKLLSKGKRMLLSCFLVCKLILLGSCSLREI